MIDFVATENYIKENKEQIISQLSDFVLTDVILFWSAESELEKIQQQKWQPLIDWCNKELNSSFQKTYSLSVDKNNKKNKINMATYLKEMQLNDLTGLFLAATKAKSVLIGVSLVKNKITAQEAFEMSFLEELYQNKFWGEDNQAVNSRNEIKEDLFAIERYLKENG